MSKRLTIGDIQIYFNDDRALYGCPRRLELPAIKTELEAACAFIERWMDLVEPPKLRRPTPEESEMEKTLAGFLRALNKSGYWDKEFITILVRAVAERCGTRWPGIPPERQERILEDVISEL